MMLPRDYMYLKKKENLLNYFPLEFDYIFILIKLYLQLKLG